MFKNSLLGYFIRHRLSAFMLSLIFSLVLTACSPETTLTATPVASTSAANPQVSPTEPPSPTATETSTPTPPLAATIPPTTAAPRPTFTTRPSLAPTATPTASPTPEITAIAVPTPAPVPLQPVKRSGGTLLIGALENNLRQRNYSPYAPDLNETSVHLQRLVWNAKLLYRDPVSLEWRPFAARGMPTVDSDGKRYAFTLRDNLVWSDGTPITSADYIYALNSFNSLADTARPPRLAELLRIETISGPDLRTLVFTFKEAATTNLNVIGLLEPLPSHIWRNLSFSNNPEAIKPSVTSGPYRPDATGLSFTPVPAYFAGRPNLERITLRTARSVGEIYDNLRVGVLNWTFEDLPNNLYEPLLASGSLTVYKWTPQDGKRRFLAYNFNNSFLANQAVRAALNKSLDLRSLLATIENGLAIEQPTFLPVSHELALKNGPSVRFNIRQAREELKKLGFSQAEPSEPLLDKQNKPVAPLRLIYTETEPEVNQVATYIRQQYQQLGLTVMVENLDAATYQKRRTAGDFELDLGTLQIPNATDPDYYKEQFITKGQLNWYGYSNPQVDKLFSEAARLTDSSQRRAAYEQLQRLLADDAPLFFLYTLQEYTVMSSNFDPTGAGAINLARWQLAGWDVFPAYLNWYATN